METSEVLMIESPYKSIIFTAAEAAIAEAKLCDAIRALNHEDDYVNDNPDHTHTVATQATHLDPDGRCCACNDPLGDSPVLQITEERGTERTPATYCHTCADELVDELEDYAAENADDALGEAL